MIVFNPLNRITAASALQFDYFRRPLANVVHYVGLSATASGANRVTSQPTATYRNSVIPHHPLLYSRVPHAPTVEANDTTTVPAPPPTNEDINSIWSNPDTENVTRAIRIPLSNVDAFYHTNQAATGSTHPVASHVTSSVDEVEQRQRKLLISVLKHAMDDTPVRQPSNQRNVFSAHHSTASGVVPHRPVTRQQTRAMRRYTQPTRFPETNQLTASPEVVPSCSRLNTARSNPLTSVAPSTSSNRTIPSINSMAIAAVCAEPSERNLSGAVISRPVRQKKTARRRTIMGSIVVSVCHARH